MTPTARTAPVTVRYDPRDFAEIRVDHRNKFRYRAVCPDITAVPAWSPTAVSVAGSRMLLDGVGWQAKYWTQGDKPGAVPTSAKEVSPWLLLQSPN